jgi:hypothetical protein
MALIKAEVTPSNIPASTGAIIEQAAEALPVIESTVIESVVVEDSTVIHDPEVLAAIAAVRAAQAARAVEQAPVAQVPVADQPIAVAVENLPVATVSAPSSLASLSTRGFEGLAFDWTSFPSISLKTEGQFEDFEGMVYGKEFTCRLRGSKERWVYRANPVVDNKRDVAFSYDRISTQNGILLEDKKREWIAQGKTVEEKLYLEAMVEMVSPGEAYDGEYRILSISPTSKGRFTGHAAKCAAMGGGDPGEVISKILVGTKITKVANPFYPWAFEVVK